MREITDNNELKDIIYNALSVVAEYCEKENIKYYLAFGSLLGAIRHGDVIPWDDDIDVMMPRPDYERFIQGFDSERYKVIHMGNDKQYIYPFAKVYDNRTEIRENLLIKNCYGVYVDIFPLDGYPLDTLRGRFQLNELILLQLILKHKFSPYNRKRSKIKQFLLPFTKLLVKPIPFRWIGKRIDSLAKKNCYEDSEYVGVVVFGYFKKKYSLVDMEPYTMKKFRYGTFRCPANSERILKNIYGDYMCLPPEEQRVCKHGARAYIRD